MKVLLVLFFILSCAMATRVKREIITEKEKQETVEMANQIRGRLAVQKNVANVNKLVYSDNVKFPDRCEYHVPDNVVRLHKRILWEVVDSIYKASPYDQFFIMTHQTALNCFNPKQKFIGCKMMECQVGDKKGEIANCICGPELAFQESDIVTGKPGSKCPGTVEDGLCVGGGSSGGSSGSGSNEGGSSSSIFSIGTLLLLAVFYLIV
uniref:SCP domain-containing protein n=1 Tax=Caenorhabditis tropicalis TaxID=1561998 RepID=A0A1I7TB46_9PELO